MLPCYRTPHDLNLNEFLPRVYVVTYCGGLIPKKYE